MREIHIFLARIPKFHLTIVPSLSSILVADFTLDLRSLNTTKVEASNESLPPLRFSNFLQHVHQSFIVGLATPENIDEDGGDHDHYSSGSMEDTQPTQE